MFSTFTGSVKLPVRFLIGTVNVPLMPLMSVKTSKCLVPLLVP